VALISSIIPADTTGGELILYRHLVKEKPFDLTIVDGSPKARANASSTSRILARLQKSRLAPFIEDCWALRRGHWLDAKCKNLCNQSFDCVLTVAHGDAYCAAQRFAKKQNLPLVSIYHDWWPDIPNLHAAGRRELERQFLDLARDSRCNLCVCEGMKEALCQPEKSTVLYPIPDSRPLPEPRLNHHKSGLCRIGYMGNLFDYGPMLQALIEESWKHPEVKIEVRGMNPEWPPEFQKQAKERGNWLSYLPRHELQNWLENLDAFLVTMSFDPRLKRRMETSFPSKLTEFAIYGKPIIIWGPSYCSAVKWAKGQGARVVVEKNSEIDVANAIKKFALNKQRILESSENFKKRSENAFHSHQIQSDFIKFIRNR
jgi:glycosyltransferase involved in cell wall biosynthesis